jgi:PAS domain S-box-containing protein
VKNWFKRLTVAQKLTLISIFFVMPDSVMLYLFVTGINANIRFTRWEKKGNEYQRPLEELLELLPQHCLLAQRAARGDQQVVEPLLRKQAKIDVAFTALEATDARIGADLQFTDVGLAKRKREHYRVHTIRMEWRDLRAGLARLDPEACAKLHSHLVTDVRTMITHAGDMSNLILDPDLDSYYLMDATLLALPQTQDRLAAVTAYGEGVLQRQTISNQEREQLAIHTTLLKEADLDRISGSVQTALNEDENFYGRSATLQARVPPALKEYAIAAEAFISLNTRLFGSSRNGVTADEYAAAGSRACDASFMLWRIADEELDTLLQKRIDYYQNRRAGSLIVAGLALLAAIGFVTFITRSISVPLRLQAAEFATANVSLQAEIAERKGAQETLLQHARLAALRGDIGVALTRQKELREILHQCVESIVGRLGAAFARIWTLNHRENVLELQASAGLYTHLDGPHSRVPVGKFKIGLIAQERKPHLTNSVVGDPRVGDQEWAKREGMVAFAGYPLLVGDQIVGVMAMFSRQPLAESTLQALASVADGIALGVVRKQVEQAIREGEARFRLIVDTALDAIVTIDAQSVILEWNPQAEKTFGWSQAEAVGRNLTATIIPPRYREAHSQGLNRYLATGEGPVLNKRIEIEALHKDGRELPVELAISPLRFGESFLFSACLRDITERKQAEAKLDKAHRELLEASRLTGRAEVATGVLHNVGNVLNSVNVSATLIADQVRKSKSGSLGKLAALLHEHAADLGAFLTADPKGKQLPGYVGQLSDHLAGEQQTLLQEVEGLRKNVEHIKEIVAMQQNYAKVSGVAEIVKVSELVEDALRMNDGAMMRHEVQVVRDFQPTPPITVDRHKAFQILINLLRNAKYACDDSGRLDKQITIAVANGDGRVQVVVSDNGIGIPAENLTRIFAHGFTTRKGGHGFGLHSGALAAKEMGGSLIAHSDGPGKGAMFTLELPLQPTGKFDA